jgi:hypothetical protein
MSTDYRDERTLKGVFSDVVKNAEGFMHVVKNHQATFFQDLGVRLETLIANWDTNEGRNVRFQLEVSKNEVGFSALRLSAISIVDGDDLRNGATLSDIEIVVSADDSVYFFDRMDENDRGKYYPAHAVAVVPGYRSRMSIDIMNDIRAKLVMIDPEYIGKHVGQTCCTALAAGQGHSLYQIKNDLV